jgi:hypothetical protein
MIALGRNEPVDPLMASLWLRDRWNDFFKFEFECVVWNSGDFPVEWGCTW